MAPPWSIEAVAASATLPLRRMVLRPGRPLGESVYPGDDDPAALHVAARRPIGSGMAPADLAGGTEGLVAVGSVLPNAPPWETAPGQAWRIRGMAVGPAYRGNGAGTAVLDRLLGHVAARGGGLVWCAARVPAVALYWRAGLRRRGAVFEAPFIGPHVHMWRTVAGRADSGHPDRL